MQFFPLLTFLLLLPLPAFPSNFFSSTKLHKNCLQIQPTKKLDMHWALSIFGGKRFYIPMGSMSGYEDLHQLLRGSELRGPEELERMCAQVEIKAFKSTIEGYEDAFLVINCRLIKKGMQDCRASPRTQHPERHAAVNGVLTLAWTDNRSGMILVQCSADGSKNHWMLYSTTPTLTEEVRGDVLKAAVTLGFPSQAAFSPNYTKCNLTSSQD